MILFKSIFSWKSVAMEETEVPPFDFRFSIRTCRGLTWMKHLHFCKRYERDSWRRCNWEMVDVPEIAAPSQMVPRHSVVFPLFLSFLFFFFLLSLSIAPRYLASDFSALIRRSEHGTRIHARLTSCWLVDNLRFSRYPRNTRAHGFTVPIANLPLFQYEIHWFSRIYICETLP